MDEILDNSTCYGPNCVPLEFICQSPNPQVPQNVILFGDKVFEEVINFK